MSAPIYASEIRSTLNNRSKDFVLGLANTLTGKTYDGEEWTKPDTIEELITNYETEAGKFTADYEKLDRESVNLRAAKDFITANYQSVSRGQLDVDNRFSLLLSLYDLDLEADLDYIVAASRIYDRKGRKSYFIQREISVSTVQESIDEFLEYGSVEILRELHVCPVIPRDEGPPKVADAPFY